MEYDCHIFSKCVVFQMKKLVFQSKYLVFRSETLNFDRNTMYFESQILKYWAFHTLNLKYYVFRAKYLVFRKLGIQTKQPVPRRLLCALVIFVCCKCLDYNEETKRRIKKIAIHSNFHYDVVIINYNVIILIILRIPSILLFTL